MHTWGPCHQNPDADRMSGKRLELHWIGKLYVEIIEVLFLSCYAGVLAIKTWLLALACLYLGWSLLLVDTQVYRLF